MPEMRKLYEKAKNKFNFLSICVDKPDKESKSKEILKDNKITWQHKFSDMNDPSILANNLPVITAFPFYMVIDKKGKIILANFGTEGFNELKNLVLK